jgi:hypothetical protein
MLMIQKMQDTEDAKPENNAEHLEDKEDVEDAKQENDAEHLEDTENE